MTAYSSRSWAARTAGAPLQTRTSKLLAVFLAALLTVALCPTAPAFAAEADGAESPGADAAASEPTAEPEPTASLTSKAKIEGVAGWRTVQG
ncbi:MAG: hypothetical protein UCH28_05820, partial [Adlercreutzia sp.]|nr:hypothetical protein [Adlercreutzia sp.]